MISCAITLRMYIIYNVVEKYRSYKRVPFVLIDFLKGYIACLESIKQRTFHKKIDDRGWLAGWPGAIGQSPWNTKLIIFTREHRIDRRLEISEA